MQTDWPVEDWNVPGMQPVHEPVFSPKEDAVPTGQALQLSELKKCPVVQLAH